MDGHTEETPRTIHDVRAMCSILRHSGPGIFEVDLHADGPRTSRSQWGDEGNERRRNKKSKGAKLMEAQWVRG